MATETTLGRLHALIWILIFGGLLTLVLGLATRPYDDLTGLVLAVLGAVAALAGFVLIYVRSRMAPSAPP